MTLSFLRPTLVLPLVGLLGCISDFSPDPYNGETIDTSQGVAKKDAGVADASKATVRRDAATPVRDVPPVEVQNDAATEAPPADGTPAPDQPVARGPCDLTGRWILSERTMSNGAGAKQVTVAWFYVELKQDGDQTTMTNTVMCGGKTTGLSPVIVQMDDSKAWPAYMANKQYDGRKGTSAQSAGGCSVTFEKRAYIRGATWSAYGDLSKALPTVDQEAVGDTPGWEDWDNDGNPGVTMKITGSVMGTLMVVARTWTQASGTIEANADSFTLPLVWGQDRSNLKYEGSPLLTAQAAKDADASQHFAELTRLANDEVSGDDAAKCQAIRQLAPTLTPNAMRM